MKKGARNNTQLTINQFQTVLDTDISFEGKIDLEEDVLIAGRVDGEIKGSGSLHLLEDAKISKYIETETCTVYGATVNGTIKVRDRLKIYNGSDVRGKIDARVIDIEAGGRVNGTIHMSETREQTTSPTSDEAPKRS